MNRVRDPFIILVADRNRYIKEYLRRELTEEGYQVILAKSAQEILELMADMTYADLLILDLDLPGAKNLSVLEKAEDRVPPLPVVVHAFSSDERDSSTLPNTVVFVEKTGNNIDRLKRVVLDMLKKVYPMRFSAENYMGREPQKEEINLK